MYWIHQIPLDRLRMFERACANDLSGLLAHKSQDGSALDPTWRVSGTIVLQLIVY